MIITDYGLSLDYLMINYGQKTDLNANFRRIPVLSIDNTEDGASYFNRLYKEMMTQAKNKKWNTIARTPSGGISISRSKFKPPMWETRASASAIEITIITKQMIRIQFRLCKSVDNETQPMYGRQAFEIFCKKCAAKGINLNDYAITNGKEIKQTIPKLLIKLAKQSYKDLIWDNCHHIDFHNSFPAGLCNTHPEFRQIIEPIYEARKTKTENKAILNYTIGFFQSIDNTGAKWANLSKDAIVDNNERILELSKRLEKSGRLPLLYNTDGIWYKGEIYHGEGEGKKLGEWENDHTNCRLRIKSDGAYEFIEDGVYHPVIRGRTRLDKIKSRDQWKWGDIYGGELTEPIIMYWVEGVGIVDENENLF